MPRVDFIEGQIFRTEGFHVRFRHRDGRDVRGDLDIPRGYASQKAAAHNASVADWKRNRFEPEYPGFTCEVLDGNGRVVPGNTLLSTVRDTY